MPAVQNVSCASPVLVVALAEAGPELSIERGVMEKTSLGAAPALDERRRVCAASAFGTRTERDFLPARCIYRGLPPGRRF